MGIKEGRYRVAGTLLINGVSTPWYDASVDINLYSMASMITARGPIYPFDGTLDLSKVPDYGAMTQKGLVTLALQASYLDTTGSEVPVQMFNLETGYVDETTDTYEANEFEVIGRSTASVFQDARIASPLAQAVNLRGDQLAAQLFSKHNVPLTIGATSPSQFVGKAYTDETYVKAYRARSEWDELTDAALQDAFVCWVHNGKGYYGPPSASTPTYNLSWGKDLIGCSINHVARRSHNIAVRVDSHTLATKSKTTFTYNGPGVSGSSSAAGGGSQTETFRVFIPNLNRNQVRARAKAVWYDLVTKEFIARLNIIPDAALLSFIAQNGANWTFTLGGVRKSQNVLYHCRQISIKMAAGDTSNPTLSVEIVAANHFPLQGVGAYQ